MVEDRTGGESSTSRKIWPAGGGGSRNAGEAAGALFSVRSVCLVGEWERVCWFCETEALLVLRPTR